MTSVHVTYRKLIFKQISEVKNILETNIDFQHYILV